MKKLITMISLCVFITLFAGLVSGFDCRPPIEFAKANDCVLNLRYDHSVHEYTCGDNAVVGDCDGGVISSVELVNGAVVDDTAKMLKKTLQTIIIILIILLIIILLLFVFKTKINDDDDEDEDDNDECGSYY